MGSSFASSVPALSGRSSQTCTSNDRATHPLKKSQSHRPVICSRDRLASRPSLCRDLQDNKDFKVGDAANPSCNADVQPKTEVRLQIRSAAGEAMRHCRGRQLVPLQNAHEAFTRISTVQEQWFLKLHSQLHLHDTCLQRSIDKHTA